jgi:hypothetical protein
MPFPELSYEDKERMFRYIAAKVSGPSGEAMMPSRELLDRYFEKVQERWEEMVVGVLEDSVDGI